MPSPRLVPSYLPDTGPNDKRAERPGQSRHPGYIAVPAVEILGGLAVLLVLLNGPAVNGLELSLFGAEGSVV